MPSKPSIHAYVSENAHAVWLAFSEEEGVSLTGLIEALAHRIEQDMSQKEIDSWVKRARKIDAQRRRRK